MAECENPLISYQITAKTVRFTSGITSDKGGARLRCTTVSRNSRHGFPFSGRRGHGPGRESADLQRKNAKSARRLEYKSKLCYFFG
jgi:hypothetical protein